MGGLGYTLIFNELIMIVNNWCVITCVSYVKAVLVLVRFYCCSRYI